VKHKVISLMVSTGSFNNMADEIISLASAAESATVCVANVHMLVEAHQDASFAEVVNNANMVTPDGMPLIWAMRLLHGVKNDRVAGMDLLPRLLSIAAEKSLPVFFYGGSQKMLDATDLYIRQNYSLLKVAGMYSPPFRPLSVEEESAVVDRINNSGARLVFVVLGCPKQEKWMNTMKGKINAAMVGVGGALPVLVGEQKRAPAWMQKNGFEWLYRLVQEPGRLWKRYFYTNTVFILLLAKAKVVSILKRK
jgi:N-acetylglucosaminyldiphosphoundecaprenol N-acetyl-beta-D-mannosaminyltransferase